MDKKSKKTLYWVFLTIILLSGILLMVSVVNGGAEKLLSSKMEEPNFQNILFLFVLILLPFAMISLAITILWNRHLRQKEAKSKEMKRLSSSANLPKKEEAEEEETSRFFMLTQTDEIMAQKQKAKPVFDEKVTLKGLCEQFRNFAANRLGLYYEASDIRQFISGLAVSHILVMQGMSGTGKTSLAYAFGEFIGNKSTIVPIQPMWKERTDLIGYYNEFTKKFNETLLLQKMYEANYSDELYITVLDEMNIARVEYYFAEFLSLLEIPNAEGRYLDVITDVKKKDPKLLKDGRLKLPVNMWFIGTANNDDSTFAISDKVYDRAMIMNLDKKSKWFDAPETNGVQISIKHWDRLVKEAIQKYKITYRNKKRIQRLDEYMIKHFHITFGNRIMKQINQYVPVMIACGGDEVEAIDDILAKKVLRKLESQNPIYVRNAADGLRTYLDELFGQDKMQSCKAYLTRLEHNA